MFSILGTCLTAVAELTSLLRQWKVYNEHEVEAVISCSISSSFPYTHATTHPSLFLSLLLQD